MRLFSARFLPLNGNQGQRCSIKRYRNGSLMEPEKNISVVKGGECHQNKSCAWCSQRYFISCVTEPLSQIFTDVFITYPILQMQNLWHLEQKLKQAWSSCKCHRQIAGAGPHSVPGTGMVWHGAVGAAFSGGVTPPSRTALPPEKLFHFPHLQSRTNSNLWSPRGSMRIN